MDVFLIGSIRKQLITILILVIFAMCLTTTNAKPTTKHKRRHEGNNKTDFYREKLIELDRLLHYALQKYLFEESSGKLNERRGNPKWIPKINFTLINRLNSGGPKRRFTKLLPHLYRHLLWYRELFNRQSNVHISVISEYDVQKRKTIIDKHIHILTNLMESVNKSMAEAKIQNIVPESYQLRINASFENFQKELEESDRFVLDGIVARAYTNALKRWRLEISCGRKKVNRKCMEQRSRLDKKQANTKARNITT